jgi:hypothetical protein
MKHEGFQNLMAKVGRKKSDLNGSTKLKKMDIFVNLKVIIRVCLIRFLLSASTLFECT